MEDIQSCDKASVNSNVGSEKSELLKSADNKMYQTTSFPETESENRYPNTVELDRSLYMDNTTSSSASLMHVIKGNLGIGIFSLPLAMMNAGTVAGPLLMVAVSVVAVHCMQMLVQCSHAYCDRGGMLHLGYAGVAEKCIGQYYPHKAHIGRILINIFLLITMFGFCAIYFLFVAESLQQAFDAYTSFKLDVKLWVLIILVPVILLSFIRTLKILAVLSSVSNVLALFGTVCVLSYAGSTVHDPSTLPLTQWKTLPLAFGAVVFTYEGIGVILPVENMMAIPRRFRWVLYAGMSLVTLLYLLMGVLGYLSCGTSCQGSITLNLPNTPFYMSVKLIIAASIFLTYFIQFYVIISILSPFVKNRVKQTIAPLVEIAFRMLLVCFTACLAIGIPQLGNMISLVGSLGSTSLAFTFPAALHIATFCYDKSLSTLSLIKDIGIIVIGVFGSVIGFYFTLKSVVENFEHDSAAHGNRTLMSTNFGTPF
ncbi:proton-coupled amino acid transporter 1 isoform X1 [Nematostella vectensis]|uniref:proton-coupled amino acid transporter 1 isoform X1 n=1 Tax=Nematostella vectensis TaxID=45351 RepID=UPI002077118E|nr:proton-coupled amino acid transporter 1 isoform X1 [Nematostella vectensis]